MAKSNYPNGFPGGLNVRGVPILNTYGGDVFWVSSGTGSNGNPGTETRPFATIDYAIGRCAASHGDIIMVKPGHAETVSAGQGINLDVAGVRVVGLGQGAARPTITMSAVASTIEMGAASCSLENLLVKTEHDNTIVVDINAADCVVLDCEFRSRTAATAREWVTCIDINGGSANACDRTRIIGCTFRSPTAGADRAIELGEVAANVEIRDCQAWGDWNDAAIHNPTGKVLTQLLIANCFLENTQTGDHSIELVSACTGMLINNMYKNDMTQATGCDPGSCFSFQCFHDDVIDTSAIVCPAVT